MRVVYAPNIKDKIDKVILEANMEAKEISRIELNDREFFEFIQLTGVYDNPDFPEIIFDTEKRTWSGSHFNYKGVPIQTHKDYI